MNQVIYLFFKQIFNRVVKRSAAFSFLMLMAMAVGVQANLLQNPGFEINAGGIADNWTSTGEASAETWSQHTGTSAMCIASWSGSGIGSFYQDVSVEGNLSYTYNLWIEALSGQYTMEVEWYNGATYLSTDSLALTDTSPSWDKRTMSVTSPATANSARVKVSFLIGSTVGNLDDFEFVDDAYALGNPNLLQNSNFESNANGGSAAENWTSTEELATENWAAHTGDWGMSVAPWRGDGTGYFSQNVSVAGNSSYTYNLWASKDTGTLTGQYFMEIDWYDGATYLSTDSLILSDISEDWAQKTINVTSPANATAARVLVRFSNVDVTGKFDDAEFLGPDGGETIPEDPDWISASSEENDTPAKNAVDGNSLTRWSSGFSEPEWITKYMGVGGPKTINKVVLNWETACAQRYQVQVSEDGDTWYTVYETLSGTPGVKTIRFSPLSVSYVRMYGISRATQWGMSLWEFEVFETANSPVPLSTYPVFDEYSVLPLVKGTPSSWYDLKAQLDPRGEFPRWFYDEFSYWTVVGDPDTEFESLISDEGVIGNYQNDFALIPYLYIDDNLIKPTDVNVVILPLEDGYLPIPTVRWAWPGGITFDQKLFSSSDNDKAYNNIWYTLENTSGSSITGKLFLTVRPFQVTPDWMYGGYVDAINSIEGSGNIVKVNGTHGFAALTAPDSFGALSYENGDVMDSIRVGNVPAETNITSAVGFASAALSYDLNIGAGATAEYKFIIPSFEDDINSFSLPLDDASFNTTYTSSKASWVTLLNQVDIDIPNTDLINALKSNIAYILISKDGPTLQPGSRNYDRSWIRDAAVMGISLLKAGQDPQIIKDFINWYTPFQYADGRIPPVLHSEGFEADRDKVINEYDAQGEYIYLIAEYYRYTGDQAFLEEVYPAIIKALQYAEERRSTRLAGYEGTRFYGILPESISHEGYPEPGMHSYWDDYWVIRGWEEAIKIAQLLNHPTDVAWMENELDNSVTGFRKCLTDSTALAMQMGGISYIPGCADTYDFDATSTAICVWPTEQDHLLDADDMMFTLDKYYNEIFIPRDVNGAIYGYTPYELRTASVYTMLGHKEKSLRMLNYFLQDRRPLEWNHWAESVEPIYRDPRYLAEMPHAWIGGIYNNAVLNLFIYPKNDALILGAGIDELWLDTQPVTVANSPSYYGNVSYTITKINDVIAVDVTGTATPPNGFVFKYPIVGQSIGYVRVNGEEWVDFTTTEVSFTNLPAAIRIYLAPPPSETTPPTPDQMTFAIAPYATGTSSIAMVASTASDANGVEYYFTCTAGGGHDSGWQASASYTDTGLTPLTQYTYTVTARDLSANQNATAPSTGASATTEMTDSDGDGMSDEWETANAFNTNDAADADGDADGDGMSNKAEFICLTNPRDIDSKFEFMMVTHPTADMLRIEWSGKAGRGYNLLQSTNLIEWTTNETSIRGEGILLRELSISNELTGFYRLEALIE
ncbi:MAG: discoidin domain-containing protein [Verrucomicrobia bacterium]|nr:discoidin domain-containing protein [Verrucomicrobiota bacterium]